MVPYYAHRLGGAGAGHERDELPRPRVEYFKMFYADTGVYTTPAMMCAYAFFGAEHLLFGTDSLRGGDGGEYKLGLAVNSVEQMAISDSDKYKIFEGNARRLLHI
jgi:aminocarboxymuconate-semialdehyde decarboxylase